MAIAIHDNMIKHNINTPDKIFFVKLSLQFWISVTVLVHLHVHFYKCIYILYNKKKILLWGVLSGGQMLQLIIDKAKTIFIFNLYFVILSQYIRDLPPITDYKVNRVQTFNNHGMLESRIPSR